MSKKTLLSELLSDPAFLVPEPNGDKESSAESLIINAELAANFLGISVIVFDALKDASIGTAFPFSFIAASLALEVLTSIQAAKDNKRAFKLLAREACELVHAVISTMKGLTEKRAEETEIDAELANHLKALVGTLREIIDFVKTHSARSRMKRFMTCRADTQKTQDYRQRIRQALDIFSLQSSITVRSTLLFLSARQETIHEELKELNDKKSSYDSVLSNISETPTLVDQTILDAGICESPVETKHSLEFESTSLQSQGSPASASTLSTEICESPIQTKKLPPGLETTSSQPQTSSAPVFDFSGSNICVSGVTFNNISGSHSQVKNIDNSNMINCNNVYYSGESPNAVFTQPNYNAARSRNPFLVHHTPEVVAY